MGENAREGGEEHAITHSNLPSLPLSFLFFADNDDYIHHHNHGTKSSSFAETYRLGHNEYSHLTLDEFHARFQLGTSLLPSLLPSLPSPF